MPKYYIFYLFLMFSCAENEGDGRGSFIKEEIENRGLMVVTDSIWENYKITEYHNQKHGLLHRYHFIDSIEPFEYSVRYNGQILMKYDSIHNEEAYKLGSTLHVLSSKEVADSINIKLSHTCPYTMKDCFSVNIFHENTDGLIDTMSVDYRPKGDVTTLRMSKDGMTGKLNITSFLCENELDRLSFSLEKIDNEEINTGE